MSLFEKLLYRGSLFDVIGELKDNLPGEQSPEFEGIISYKDVPYAFRITRECLLKKGRHSYVCKDKTTSLNISFTLLDGVLDGNCSIRLDNTVLFEGTWIDGKRHGHFMAYNNGANVFSGNYCRDLLDGDINYGKSESTWTSSKYNMGQLDTNTVTSDGDMTTTTYYDSDRLITKKVFKIQGSNSEITLDYFGDGYPHSLRLSNRFQILNKREFSVNQGKYMMASTVGSKLLYYGEYLFVPPCWFVMHHSGELYENHQLIYRGSFSYGLRSGKGTLYYPNGKPKYSGAWDNDMPNGKGRLYTEDGTLFSEIVCSNGMFSCGLRSYSVLSFVPESYFWNMFFNTKDESQFVLESSVSYDPLMMINPDLDIDYDQTTSPVLRYNADTWETLKKAENMFQLIGHKSVTPSQIRSLVIEDSIITNSDFVLLFGSLIRELVIGNSNFKRDSRLVLKNYLSLRVIRIGNDCFSGSADGILELENDFSLQTVRIGASFLNGSSIKIKSRFCYCFDYRLLQFVSP